jgi:hypothetical protein
VDNPPADETVKRKQQIRLWVLAASIYVVLLAAMFVTGRMGFVVKALIVPALFLVAALQRRFREFVLTWSIFLAVVASFDAVRGLIYSATSYFELPFYLGYVIDAERALLGGAIAPIALQAWLPPQVHGDFERLLVVAHASHFLVFLMFGLLEWTRGAAGFARFRRSFYLAMGIGAFFYAAVPTVPPWMAARTFEVIPRVERVSRYFYNVSIPAVHGAFDTNPIAAMPSLHTAFPVLICLLAARSWGWRSWPIFLYAVSVLFGIMYMGEHYAVDVVAGIAVAVVAFWGGSRWARCGDHDVAAGDLAWRRGSPLRRTVLAAGCILVFPLTVGALSAQARPKLPITERFIERELDGRSPLAETYRAARAAEAGDTAAERRAWQRALEQVTDEGRKKLIRRRLRELAGREAER